LEDANIKLDLVVIDVLGLSGRRILQALIAGQTVPQALAALADRRIHATSAQLEAALRGRVTDHHRFMLKLHLDQIDAQTRPSFASIRRSTATSNLFGSPSKC
jgi:hypothetical protein